MVINRRNNYRPIIMYEILYNIVIWKLLTNSPKNIKIVNKQNIKID